MADPKLVAEVEKFSKSKSVVIYMKGDMDFPQCGFSARAVQVVKAAGVKKEDIATFDVLSDDPMWDALEEYTQWPTCPQVFVKGKFIGGSDIVMQMHESGELKELLSS